MEIKKFAAIDIGSNSVRLLIVNVIESREEVLFKKSCLVRVPVRLGASAFKEHNIPEPTILKLIDAMIGFKYLMKVNDVLLYKGCATSAMREAANGSSIVQRIKDETGITVDIISGEAEASLIYSSQKNQVNKIGDNCIFVDVGGGSTEITVFAKGEPSAAQSFDIGTIRILEDQVSRNNWKEMKDWLQEHTDRLKTFSLIGSGGNINRISKMAELKAGKFMTFDQLKDILDEIKLYSIDDRIKLLDLNPDRADVIVPAGEIFINVMKWTETKKIFVPKIGLGDGIVREVYKEYSRGKRLGTLN